MGVGTTGSAPEQPYAREPAPATGRAGPTRPTEPVGPTGPTGPATSGPTRPAATGRRPARLLAALALAAGAVAVWELGAIHDDGPLLGGEPWGWGSCQSRSTADGVDFTVGGVLAEPTADVVVLDVRAVRPQNLVVREGVALPFLGDRDGDGMQTVAGEAPGYPPDELGSADVVWAQGDPLVGALLVHGAPTNLVWRAEVRDTSRDARYDGVEIEYRSGHRRYVAVVHHDLLVPGGVDPEACLSR